MMIPFLAFPFIQALVIILCFVRPLKKIPLWAKILLALVLGLGSLKIYIFIFTGGTLMDPKQSRVPAMIADAFYFSSIFVFLLTLIRMIVNGIYKLSRFDKSKFIIPSSSIRYGFVILLLGYALGVKGVVNGFAPPIDKNYTITMQNLPKEAHGFKIALLADLHISAPSTQKEVVEVVNRTNALKPDLIVIAGDFVDGEIDDLDFMTKELFKLNAKYGVYAVSGNHELYSGYKEWLDYFTNGGIKFLENKGTIIKDDNGTELFNLCGVIDISASRFNLPTADIKAATKEANPTLPNVFLTHQPKIAPQLNDISDLTLAGHTHGGLMPGLKQIVAGANGGFVSGLYEVGRQRVIVSNGTRIWAGAPLRLNTPSELILIKLN